MASGEQITALAMAALDNDRDRLISLCRQIVAREKSGSALRCGMEKLLNRPATSGIMFGESVPSALKGLVLQTAPALLLEDVVLPAQIVAEVEQFIHERQHAPAIRSAGFRVPHRLLLSGPPGNGKTTLAGAIASALRVPFFMVDYSAVISSYMGETGSKLAKIFRGVDQGPVVLFVDEMETVLAERNRESKDVGEMARVVSTLLLEIDRLQDDVVLIGATNHKEMLDRAVVRRFEHHWELPAPDQTAIRQWLQRFAERHPTVPIREREEYFVTEFSGDSLSALECGVVAWCRRWIVERSCTEISAHRQAVAEI